MARAQTVEAAVREAAGNFSTYALIAEAQRRGPITEDLDAAFPRGASVEQLEDGDLFAILAHRLAAHSGVSTP